MNATVILPLMFFALVVICLANVSVLSGRGPCRRESLLQGAVVSGMLTVLFTEILGLLDLLDSSWLTGLWTFSNAIAILVIFRVRRLIPSGENIFFRREKGAALAPALVLGFSTDRNIRNRVSSSALELGRDILARRANWPGRVPMLLVSGLLAIVAITGLTAVLTPPNTYDSMTYHLPRIAHWIQNQSVDHYPTHIQRQLHFPPGAEFFLTHLQILAGNDRLANLLQWSSMIGSVVGVSLVAKRLGSGLVGQVFASIFVATLPMGMLQASSTQNDYVVTFWLVCFTYFTLETIRDPRWYPLLAVGGSLGLALLTKLTAYIFAGPLLALLIVNYAVRLRLCWRFWIGLLLMSLLVITINLGHYVRNVSMYGTPLGPTEEADSSYINEVIGIRTLLSNVIRNTSLHVNFPLGSAQYRAGSVAHLEQWVTFVHDLIGIGSSDLRTTWGVVSFSVEPFHMHEDLAGNPFHLLLVLISIILICIHRQDRCTSVLAYAGALLLGFLLFCMLVKWQLWHSRLHLPLFVLWAPAVSVTLAGLRSINIYYGMATILLISALVLVGYNETRSIYGQNSIFSTERSDQYFATRSFGPDYRNAIRYLRNKNYQYIGLVLASNAYEYPFWVLLGDSDGSEIHIRHVLVANQSASKSSDRPFKDDAIICVSCDVEQLEHIGRNYRALHRFGIVSVIDGSGQGGANMDTA